MVFESLMGFATSSPQQFLLSGIGLFALFVLADFETGVSLRLPARRRLSFAGIILAATVSIYFFVTRGVSGVIDRLASDIFSAIIIGAILAIVFMGVKNR